MSNPAFRFDDASVSHPGKVRTRNEDSYVARGEGLWAVADGMGGHENGQWASRTIAEALQAAPLTGEFDADAALVADAIHAANATIYATAQENGASMGSTTAALLVCGKQFAVFWAGDSRCYLWRGGMLLRLTRDHTQVQQMVDAGYLTEEEAKGHPMSHVLARAVGVEPKLELEAVSDEAEVGDKFLLCSDGLTGVVTDAEIAEHLAAQKPKAASEQLVELCLSRGAPDNVTVVIVACDEVTQLALA